MRALGGGKPGGVRLRLGRAAAWFGFGVADRRYRGAGEGGGRLSPAGSGLSPVEASVFYQWFSPGRVSVLHPTSFDDALVLADRFK
ncbi:MAG: hypothetical protein M3N18_01745, partial [Actinomycetota bacterium]|nr:hypothetical protein [Actinomycetota bacterium]